MLQIQTYDNLQIQIQNSHEAALELSLKRGRIGAPELLSQ